MKIEIDFKTIVGFLVGVLLTLLTEFLFLSGYVVCKVKEKASVQIDHYYAESVLPFTAPEKARSKK